MNSPSKRLRIVHAVRSDAFAGVERYITGVANELTTRGHSVAVIGGDPIRMATELSNRVTHRRAASTFEVWRSLARERQIDVVHAHMTAAEVAAAGAEPFNRAPIVATRHFPDRRLRRWPALGALLRSRLDVQISISAFVASGVGEPSVVIHNGVQGREQVDLQSPSVLMLQRLQPEKASADGLRAWARSHLPQRGWTLHVGGAGVLEAQLRELATNLGVQSSVRFLGSVADTDSLFRGSSIFLAPAPAEPFGLSVVEAMAYGIPVVAAGGGAHAETVGSDGRVFDAGDVDAAARQLVELADAYELRREVGARLRAKQRQHFSVEVHVDKLEALYHAIG